EASTPSSTAALRTTRRDATASRTVFLLIVVRRPHIEPVIGINLFRSGHLEARRHMVTGDDGLPDRLSQVVLRVAQRLVAFKVEVHQNHTKSPIAQLRQQFPVAQ